MRMVDLIEKKRDGFELSKEEIDGKAPARFLIKVGAGVNNSDLKKFMRSPTPMTITTTARWR